MTVKEDFLGAGKVDQMNFEQILRFYKKNEI